MTGKRSAKKVEPPTGRPTAAPGQFYGFSIQITRVVAHLLRCRDGQAVSLECLDDVAVTGPDGSTAEQVKSGLAHNPLGDRSTDLWKTLHNWVEAIRAGALGRDTQFILYTAQAWEGALVKSLHEAASREECLAVIRRMRVQFWGAGPRYSKKESLPDSLASHVNGVLEASDDVLNRIPWDSIQRVDR